jgi:hypothetical protein
MEVNMDNVNIRCFKDGNRFIVAFEGLDANMEEMIKGLLHATMASSGNAKPVKENPDQCKEIAERVHTLSVSSRQEEAGFNANVSPKAVILKYRDRGFRMLSESLTKCKGNDSEIKAELKSYLKTRFDNIDPWTYAAKLSEKQCMTFFTDFDSAIMPSWKASLAKQAMYLDFATFVANATLEQKQSAIAGIIEKLKSIYQKTA